MQLDSYQSYCPYCGEPIELVIDLSVEEQEYIEDCFVCCRPMVVTAIIDVTGINIYLKTENE